MTKFYVYEHWRPDIDMPFYVGKGKGKRANIMYGRNRRHKNIQSKLKRLGMFVEVKMVANGLTEEEAFQFEVNQIAMWRSKGVDLVNLTAGGEGGSNPSDETRELMRRAKIGRKLTTEQKEKISKNVKIVLSSPEMKTKLSISIKESSKKPEVKENRSKGQKSRIRTKEHYEKVSAALMGRKLSPEHAEKSRKASLGRKQSIEEIERRRLANTGRKRSPEFCARMSNAWTEERKKIHALEMLERNRKNLDQKRIEEGLHLASLTGDAKIAYQNKLNRLEYRRAWNKRSRKQHMLFENSEVLT